MKKVLAIIILNILIISFCTNIYAKYVVQEEFCIANLNIDRTKPKIELVNISNTNTEYPEYANNEDTITIKIKVIESNIKNVFLDSNHIKAMIDNTQVEEKSIIISDLGQNIYQIQLKNLKENGKLKLDFLEGTVVDKGDLKNEEIMVDTKITIDNTAPTGNLIEKVISDGRVNAVINLSETIRKIDGWKMSDNNLNIEKEFTNNISYELPIEDYAGNKAIVNVNITKATYIKIVYASHNSNIGWTYGYGNYDVAGGTAVKQNPKYKTEALAFNVSGNIDNDFVQANAYVHTYWGEGSKARCTSFNIIYNHGYNPGKDMYKSMASNDLVTLKGKKYFQLGGGGVNSLNQTDINGRNPVPASSEYNYGISGIKIKLKDYSYFSIVYQVLVNNVGWINTCSDGQECMYDKTKPISAFRIALIPNSEKQYIIDTWNKDVGTYNFKK